MLVYWKVDQNRSRDWDKTLPHAGAATVVLSDVICCQGGKKIYIYIWYLVIKHGNGISPIKGSFDKKNIIYKWMIFQQAMFDYRRVDHVCVSLSLSLFFYQPNFCGGVRE